MNLLMTIGGACALAIIRAPAAGAAAAPAQIHWAKDLAVAEKQAVAQKKLVLEFLLLGDLSDPHC